MKNGKSILSQPTCYCSPKLEGKKTASQKGQYGLFARQSIAAGERLVVWGGQVVTSEEIHQLEDDWLRLLLQIDDDLYLLTTREGPGDWVNHSCDPNAGLEGQIKLVAMRDIAEGEEICFDYATCVSLPSDGFACHCGSTLCRSHFSGNDWMIPHLQEKYRGYFSPFIQKKIDRIIALESSQQPDRQQSARVTG